MSACERSMSRLQRGMGLIEVMVSVVIGLLLVLVIYQIYEVSEGQKRTITAGSDAQQNASYGLYVLARDLAIAGNGIASAATDPSDPKKQVLDGCPLLRPIPVLIEAGATDDDPDMITVLYGGSSSLSTPLAIRNLVPTITDPFSVQAPVGFSPGDVIVATQITPIPHCTLSTVTAISGLPNSLGLVNITQTPLPGSPSASYDSSGYLVNLGQPAAMGRVVYTVDPFTLTLRTQKQLPANDPVTPVVSDVFKLKAQYGIDSNCDGTLTWQAATGPWSSANVPTLPLPIGPPYCVPGVPSLRQIQAVRVAIVTRSTQLEFDGDTRLCIVRTPGPLKMLDDTVEITLIDDEKCYRYKVLETVVPLRNALWNSTP